ncbi:MULTISPECIES: hypothetical protein [Pseudomonas]|uniref:Uncharacterized protein n=1 Tax=Pseudomonas monteilii TaxID=76759 RepID=A0A399M154_9PSED|nr:MULTISPECIES: hypothetical protein [Pseudomonas]MBI6921608.1 hypothetical protein [Pseudomonas monteilii]MCE0939947.1 hypothetical protein [Pseudomonas kurunegalensis]RII75480.1 hypothetical protein D0894_20870 [Pseudomonas monteilii]
MSIRRPVSPIDLATELAQLHADVAAFHAEMRQAERANPLKLWLPLTLGAGLALMVFTLVTLLPRVG